MFIFKSVTSLLFCMLLLTSTILSLNASPIKPSSALEVEAGAQTDSSTSPSIFSKIISYPKKAASKTFETVGAFLSVLGESLSSEPDEAIIDETIVVATQRPPSKSEYSLKDIIPQEKEKNELKKETIVKIPKSLPASSESESKKKGIFEKIGESFENLI
uniref:Uncharacterized protein n=1 Tax=Panagrolaimus sp. ES5 TaxID=591445 RepID=A0AC34F1I3_9BILA